MIDGLCDQTTSEDITVASLYCDHLAQQDQTITNLVGAMLTQLVCRRSIPGYLREAFQEGERTGRGPQLATLMKLLKIAIASLPQVFICIDGLDEYQPEHLPELLESLRDIVRESPTTRIFLTGRIHVREDIQRYFPKAALLPISPNRDDIKNYLEMRLDRDADPEAMKKDLREHIVKIILEKVSDMSVRAFSISDSTDDVYLQTIVYRFLLVSLIIDAVLEGMTFSDRRKKLEEMTQGKGLDGAYEATLKRLKAQKRGKSELGLGVLMWVLYSERPLRTEELRHALGVEMGTADLDLETVPALRTLLASCLSLVKVDASSSTVLLEHLTLREHLLSDSTLFPSPHSTIAEVCLTYLNFRSVGDLSPTRDPAASKMPLLAYASCYWGEHTRMGMTEKVKSLALKLLGRFDEHISTQLLFLHYHDGRYFHWLGGPTRFTGLHGAAFFGIVEIVAAVLEMREWDVDAPDNTGSTALTWAARRGHEEVVEMLLEQGNANPNTADTQDGWTPLAWAAQYGHEGVVKILLESQYVNPNTIGTAYGQTTLLWAAKRGQEEVVRMLLKQEGVNPDQTDTQCGRTPLSLAAENGHEGVVKMLLKSQDVNPNTADTRCGRTPLQWAARRGHEGVVKVLLKLNGVNPDQAGAHCDRTPLSLAAEHGHEGVVKMLLEGGDISLNTADTKYGQTPLWWAAARGREGVVRMLLKSQDVNPNTADTRYGRTPLEWAIRRGQEEVVKMLLGRGDVNPNQVVNAYGQTPLSWAAWRGHEEVVRVLLGRGDVKLDQADTRYGRTPLSLAAERGYEGVVRALLESQGVNLNTADTRYGQTPLEWAAQRGHEGVVKMLSGWKDVHTNTTPDNKDQARLSLADGKLALPPIDPDGREVMVDFDDSVSVSADSDSSLTEPSRLPQHSPTGPLEFWDALRKAGSYSSTIQSILAFTADGSFIIPSLICLLAFILYVLPDSELGAFSFCGCLLGVGLVWAFVDLP